MRAEAAIGRILDWWAARSSRQWVLISLISALVIVPGLTTMPVTDRDEARFAQATKQMLETGDLIDIRFQDQPRWKKPAGIYWLQAASAKWLGGGVQADIWAYRIPSALAAWLAALATAWAARPLLTRRGALLAGMMMATTLLLAAEGNIAKTDAALTATAAIVLGALSHLIFGRAGLPTALLFWLAVAAAILLKGPIVPAIAALAVAGLAFRRETRQHLGALRPLIGIPLVVVLVAPWLIAIWLVSDGAFFTESLGKDMAAKIASGQEKHGGPPGLYLGLVWVTFWPWAALIPLALGWAWHQRGTGWLWMVAAWIVPFWIILEAVPTKLPHYVLPLYPALALLIAGWMTSATADPPRWRKRLAAGLVATPTILAALALCAGLIVILMQSSLLPRPLENTAPPWIAAILIIGAAVMAILSARAILGDRRLTFATTAIAASILLFTSLLQFGLPRLGFVFPSPAMAQTIAQWRACASGPAFSIGYHEPSLVFRTETGIRMADPTAALDALANDPGAMLLLTDRWRDILQDIPPSVTRAEFHYFNYNRGKTERAVLLTPDDARWLPCTSQ